MTRFARLNQIAAGLLALSLASVVMVATCGLTGHEMIEDAVNTILTGLTGTK